MLSFSKAVKESAVFTQSILMKNLPLMYITTRQGLVEDGQWSRRGWMASLISTAAGLTTKMASVISSFVNIGLDWKRSTCLTRNKTENKLRVNLGVNTSKTVHDEYKWFGVENETVDYKLRIGDFSRKPVYSSLIHDHCHRWSLLSPPLNMVNLTALYLHVSISNDCVPWKYRCYSYVFILLCISHSWVQP